MFYDNFTVLTFHLKKFLERETCFLSSSELVSFYIALHSSLTAGITCYQDQTTHKLRRQSVRGEILANLLGLLYNLLRHTGDRFLTDDSQAIQLLLPLSKLAVPEFAVDSLLCLAYIIDEANNHLVMSGTGTTCFHIRSKISVKS